MMGEKEYRAKLLGRLVLFSLVIFILSAITLYFPLKKYFNAIYFVLILFNVLITYAVLTYLLSTFIKSPKRFNNTYLLFLPLKFIVYLIFFAVYIFINKANAIPFTIVFLIFYFLFSAFEVKEILQFSKIK